MIDFHCHILPGLDDGAISIDDSIAMARSLENFGYKTVYCTPHCIKGYYAYSPQKVREATLMLQADLDNADISLELLPGLEYMLDENFVEYVAELLPLADTRLILCEAPQDARPEIVQENLELIFEQGYIPLIAHPERTQYFIDILSSSELQISANRSVKLLNKPKDLFKRFWPFASRVPRSASRNFNASREFSLILAEVAPQTSIAEQCLYHANLGSFTGYYGVHVQRQAYNFLKQGVYTALASDLHDGSSAAKILVNDKFETNPLLKKLAEFDGSTDHLAPGKGDDKRGQGELF